AAIAAKHSLAPSFDETDWSAILGLYEDLIRMHPSPVHELNRAIVVAQISGPDAGLAAIQNISGSETLQDYHLLHATVGEFHRRAGRAEQARDSFRKAMQLTVSASEQQLLERKVQQCEALTAR